MLEITKLADLFAAIEAAYSDFPRGTLWWRGQGKTWPLLPPAYRVTDRGPYERGVILYFRSEAPLRYADCPAMDDFAGWLFLAQHYGVPTRLLDWTASPLIALFFAVREMQADADDAGLYALDPAALNREQAGLEATISSYELKPAFENAFSVHDGGERWKRVFALTPEETHSRAAAQQSRFTIHGDSTPFDHIPGHNAFMRAFRIPASAKNRLRHELDRAGIHGRRLFPDLDHLADWVKAKCFCGHRPCPHNLLSVEP